MKLTKKILLFFAVVIVAIAILYVKLGGAESLELKVIERQATAIRGTHFKGRINHPNLKKLFARSREVVLNEQGVIAVVNYQLDSAEAQTSQFIGVIYAGEQNSKKQYETLMMESGRYVEVSVKSHNLVMPDSEEVEQTALEFAEKNGLQIDTSVSFEIYEGDRSLKILFKSKN